ncbi:MAG: FMN-binding negative transcriptional regulator [Burkholderiaceae bacterium]|nr:FMN-binding negative transcriptional regulator [Burkholderiaceae bacterium]
MYHPPQFIAKDRAHALDIIRAHPFASLISVDDAGLPFVTHLPLHVEENPSTGSGRTDSDGTDVGLTLFGHCAKPNPHWKYLLVRPRAVVTFMGPHAYLSPQVYPDVARVPSWNYLAVHCTVQATLIEEPLAKDRLLKKLIGDHEPRYAQQWMDLGAEFQHKMLAGIVGFELQVLDLQCKIKLNQHRPESHAALHAKYAEGNEDERALADWMVKLGLKFDK